MNSRLVGWFLLGLGGWGCANSDVVGGDVALAHSPVPSLQDDASDGGFQDAGQSRETNSTGSRLKRTATDDHCDGTADHDCTVYEYDSAGDPSSYSVDSDCDGVAERLCKAPEFDVHGSLTSVDADCDGTPEFLCNEVIRDADGNVIRQALDADCVTRSFDASGELTSERTDYGCDGTHEDCSTIQIDTQGNVTMISHDQDCDGKPDYCDTSTYE